MDSLFRSSIQYNQSMLSYPMMFNMLLNASRFQFKVQSFCGWSYHETTRCYKGKLIHWCTNHHLSKMLFRWLCVTELLFLLPLQMSNCVYCLCIARCWILIGSHLQCKNSCYYWHRWRFINSLSENVWLIGLGIVVVLHIKGTTWLDCFLIKQLIG